MYTFSDLHVHLLPGMDSGPLTLEESVAMFHRMYSERVRLAVLTPHFFGDRESIEVFLVRRAVALKKLKTAVGAKARSLRLLPAAEVALFPGLTSLSGLERLCIPGTRLLPVTFPLDNTKISKEITLEVSHILHHMKLQLLICHVERQFPFYSQEEFEKLLSLPYSSYLISVKALSNQKLLPHLLKAYRSGKNLFLGSNGHDTIDLPPTLFPKYESEIVSQSGLYIKKVALEANKMLCQELTRKKPE